MEEIELSEQCRLGNNRARKELYEQYAGRMLGICLRYTGDRDTAQDLLHDGFLKIHKVGFQGQRVFILGVIQVDVQRVHIVFAGRRQLHHLPMQ